MQKNGKLIVIEGLDGSGKGTLSAMLCEEMQKRGIAARRISFPMYDSPGAIPVKLYLDGKLGEHPEDTGAFAASTLYAVDRYISYRVDWGKALESPDSVIIADRYTTSNAIHQLTKLPKDRWDDFLAWLFDFEYEKLALPVPDATLYIELPPTMAKKLIAARSAATGRQTDIHEQASDHLDRAYEAAIYAAEKLGWKRIPNFMGDDLRPLAETFAEVLQKSGF